MAWKTWQKWRDFEPHVPEIASAHGDSFSPMREELNREVDQILSDADGKIFTNRELDEALDKLVAKHTPGLAALVRKAE